MPSTVFTHWRKLAVNLGDFSS